MSAWSRSRLLDAPGRIGGIDLARGIAVIGMLSSHLLWTRPVRLDDPGSWASLGVGHSSILFALLAGVALGIISGGATPVTQRELGHIRRSVAVRAIVLWLIGLAVIATGVPVYVILPAYGALFLLSLPVLGASIGVLWAGAAGAALLMPWVVAAIDDSGVWRSATGSQLTLILGWNYPFPVWLAFLLAGIALSRMRLENLRTQLGMLAGGAASAALGFGADAAAPDDLAPPLSAVWTAAPHSSGILEVIGSGGLAVAILAACLLLCRLPLAQTVTIPLRAVGAMPLTAYVGQLLAWALLAAVLLDEVGDLAGFRYLNPFVPFVLVTVVLCTLWALRLGRGPLERLLDIITRGVAPRRR